ncbi:hypothetical protein K435DRAFT_880904 [Dendrothele bispora CBS 962.96]|uniref:Uncharacterized protein n=1 Tax=Dendrothele bispora (strain CBS 962.96) TaxID=1314807 RepID=A0A4S8KIZ5_DENBC|nr:hypothetical protein K435DRAFT_880904 [Dendrothele bispora CBS 962.96]
MSQHYGVVVLDRSAILIQNITVLLENFWLFLSSLKGKTTTSVVYAKVWLKYGLFEFASQK